MERYMFPRAFLERQQAYQTVQATPEVNHMVDLDLDMKNVLESSLPATAKLQKYDDMLRRYRVQTTPSAPLPQASQQVQYYEPSTDLIARIPKQKKRAAETLLSEIAEIDDIKFDKNKRLMIKGTVVPHSNATDLINYLSRDLKQPENLPGITELLKVLAEHNVADSSIGNKVYQAKLRAFKLGDDDMNVSYELVTPPSNRRRRQADLGTNFDGSFQVPIRRSTHPRRRQNQIGFGMQRKSIKWSGLRL